MMLEDIEEPPDESDSDSSLDEYDDEDVDGNELLRIRGGGDPENYLPPAAASIVKANAAHARASIASKQVQTACVAKPAAPVKQPTKPPVVYPQFAKPPTVRPTTRTTAPHQPASVAANKPAISIKRKRPTKVCISYKSPVFNAVQDIRKPNKIVTENLTTYADEWLKFALANVIKPGITLFKLEHKIHRIPNSIVHNRTINKHQKHLCKSTRRSKPYFRSDHYRAIWLENNDKCAQEVMAILNNTDFYPVYLTLQRWIKPIQPTKSHDDACNPPPAKRMKIHQPIEVTPQPQNNVICLLDSSDEEDESETTTNSQNQKILCLCADEPIESSPIELTAKYDPPSDPIRPNFKASDNGDFVLTPYGAGKIISSRVDRHASVSGNASIFKPTLIFTIDLHFGICHVPSHQVKTISGTPYVSKPLLTYSKIPITEMDLLRLRPMTYLNDSIINFYLKYLRARSEEGKSKAVEAGRGWGDLDGNGVYIFPSFCYNQIVNILGDSTANNKKNRQKIWKDLKTWTKGEDIFKKQMLVFPVNYNLHWTALFVFHPGRLIRRHAIQDKARPVVTDIKGAVDIDSITKSLEKKVPGTVQEALRDKVSGAIKKCITDIVDKIASPLRTRWKCDFCKESLFETYEEACEHEKRCSKNYDFCILHFDSGKHFKLHNSQTIAAYVRKYLSAYYDSEYAATHPNLSALTQNNLPSYTVAVPQQDNTKDCGVYMLEIVERMLANPPVVDNEFVKKKCKVFAKDLFGKDVIEKKRGDILQLVHNLREGQDVS